VPSIVTIKYIIPIPDGWRSEINSLVIFFCHSVNWHQSKSLHERSDGVTNPVRLG